MLDGRFAALMAALLFGSSTPAAKRLLGSVDPIVLAGLFYSGSAVLLVFVRQVSRRPAVRPPGVEMVRLAGAIACGAVFAPLALFWGLTEVSATAGSLLLTTETMFTAGLATLVFGETLAPRTSVAIVVMTIGAALVGWEGEISGEALGMAAIVVAAALWGLDNNLTRDVRGMDATAIAMWKGIVGATVNLGLGFALGRSLPETPAVAGALVAGAITYGGSLVAFVIALRAIGAARTGAFFATGPAFGAALGILWLGEPLSARIVAAAVVLGVGVAMLFNDGPRESRTP
jgi:drug/metabolite transporter (DMT)-like permease